MPGWPLHLGHLVVRRCVLVVAWRGGLISVNVEFYVAQKMYRKRQTTLNLRIILERAQVFKIGALVCLIRKIVAAPYFSNGIFVYFVRF
jgi:hypothetical protein